MTQLSFDLVHTILERLHVQAKSARDAEAKQTLKQARFVNDLWNDAAVRLVFREIDIVSSLKRAQARIASSETACQSYDQDYAPFPARSTEAMAKYTRRIRASVMAWTYASNLNGQVATTATIQLLSVCIALQHVHLRGIPIFVRHDAAASEARAALCQLNNLRSLEIAGRDSFSENGRWEADMSLVDVLSLVVHWPHIESLELPSLLSVGERILELAMSSIPSIRTLKNVAVGFHPSCSTGDIHLLASRLAASPSLTHLSLSFGGSDTSPRGSLTPGAADALRKYFSGEFEEDEEYGYGYGVGSDCQWAESLRELSLEFITQARTPAAQRHLTMDIGLEHLHNLQKFRVIAPSLSSSLTQTPESNYPIALDKIDTLPSLMHLSLTAPFALHYSFSEALLHSITQITSTRQDFGANGHGDNNGGPPRIAYPSLRTLTLEFNDRFSFADLLALRNVLDQIRAARIAASHGYSSLSSSDVDERVTILEISSGPEFPELLRGSVNIPQTGSGRNWRRAMSEDTNAGTHAHNGDTWADGDGNLSHVQLINLNEVYREWMVFAPMLVVG